MKVTLREKQLKDKGISLYLDIYHSGKRRYEFLNLYLTKDKEQNKKIRHLATKIRDQRALELANDEYGFVSDNKKNISFIDYFQKIESTYKKHSIYYSTLKHLKDFTKSKIFFKEIDEKFLIKFQEYLQGLSISKNSAREYFSVTKRILKRAVRDKIIQKNPADFVDNIKGNDVQRDFLNESEVKLLAKTECKYPDIKRAFLLSCFTGLRFSDIKQLKWNDIKEDHIQKRIQKTQDFIYIPLSITAKSILNNNNNIFPLPDNLVFTLPKRWFSNHILKQWFKQAEIDINAHWHISRHTFASLNITQGAELYTVSKLLGHKNLRTTEIYSRLVNEKKKEAIDRLPVIEIMN
ncbi:site-specific integrase [Clostridium sp.]|uniref:site-specific integrase n=1 Tax=Clostridium sp. TaxID=1506 RepID=UPI00284D7E79|nr:site-specific integrase [Clostridium sp.]MDR3596488.1 site-specific integrase [Clostridium sp.]